MPKPRMSDLKNSAAAGGPAPELHETFTLAEATRFCGWSRPNTFRERFLVTQQDRDRLIAGLDARGRLLLHGDEVRELTRALERERAARGNWRPLNLGPHARRAESESDGNA